MMTKQNSLLSPLDKIKLNYKPNAALNLAWHIYDNTLSVDFLYKKLGKTAFWASIPGDRGKCPSAFWKYTRCLLTAEARSPAPTFE